MISNAQTHIGRQVKTKITTHGGAIVTNSACYIPLLYAVPGGIVAGGHIFAKDALDRDLLARGSVCTSADGGKRPRLELLC